MNLDVERGLVTFAGVSFPACAVICPPHPGGDRDEWQRSLGGSGRMFSGGDSVIVPFESGAFMMIEDAGSPGLVNLILYTARCVLDLSDMTDIAWLPELVQIDGGRLHEWWLRGGPWQWDGADEEWTAEHLARVARLPLDDASGPLVRFVPLTYIERLRSARQAAPA